MDLVDDAADKIDEITGELEHKIHELEEHAEEDRQDPDNSAESKK